MVDEPQFGQGEDAVAVERRLEREVEAGEGFDVGQPGHHEGGLDAATFAQRELLSEHGVDRLERAHLAPLELAHDGIDDFQRARHAQPDEVCLDAVHGGGGGFGAGAHHAVPFTASTRPSAS